MREPLILFLIYGAALLLAALRLHTARDPRQSILFVKVHGKISLEDALALAKKMSKAIFIIGCVIVAVCGILLLTVYKE